MSRILLSILCLVALVQIGSSPAHAERVIRAAKAKKAATPECKSIIPLGKIIWKGCAASGHLSGDPRGKGVALIAVRGTALRPSQCIPILNSNGAQIGGLQMYPGNDPRGPYQWRAYSNYGCGAGITQTKLASKAKGNPIFLVVNGRGQCIQINKANSNINSAQRC